MQETQAIPSVPAPQRVVAIDAYRGFVMLLMLMECLNLAGFARQFPDSSFWNVVAIQTTHVRWVGFSLHDLIQPSFSFLVGAALVYSTAARRAKQAKFGPSLLRAIWRSLFLIAWGVILRSTSDQHPRTNFTFEDTLSQIGLGFVPLFLLAQLRMRWWWLAFGIITVGYWLAFVIYPIALPDFDYASVGVPADWQYHSEGIAAHWNKNSNVAWAFDTWFLNLFPRPESFRFNGGGYCTLSFIPTLATMILGLIGGELLRRGPTVSKSLLYLIFLGVLGLAIGRALNDFGVCPLVKRIWTPSWVLFSGGWCFLILMLFYATTDAIKRGAWSYPLCMIGANSILIYTIAELPVREWLLKQIQKHVPADAFNVFGEKASTLLANGLWLIVAWLFLWWLYRKRIFLRV